MKICVITGTRAEYGLLKPLIKKIDVDPDLDLQLIVTGSHLSESHGLTYKEIEEDFTIDKKVEILLYGDSSVSVSKAMGLAQISISEAFKELCPDVLIILGDRFEILACAISAMIARIPIVHISGGEKTEGAIDEAIRHSITKMSHVHFVSTNEYKNRVIQLGEHPSTVFNVGALSIDNIINMELMCLDDFEAQLNFKLNKKNILVTLHPETLLLDEINNYCSNFFTAIDTLVDTNIIFTGANTDMGGAEINSLIMSYVNNNHHKAIRVDSLGQLRYLSALQFVDAVVGNSSSGIVEAPSFNIGTINIGSRQAGRLRSESIIDCTWSVESILSAFSQLYSANFQARLGSSSSSYGDGSSSANMINIIKTINYKTILSKSFYDLDRVVV